MNSEEGFQVMTALLLWLLYVLHDKCFVLEIDYSVLLFHLQDLLESPHLECAVTFSDEVFKKNAIWFLQWFLVTFSWTFVTHNTLTWHSSVFSRRSHKKLPSIIKKNIIIKWIKLMVQSHSVTLQIYWLVKSICISPYKMMFICFWLFQYRLSVWQNWMCRNNWS